MLNLVDKNKLVVEMTSKARGSEVSLKTDVLNRFSENSAASKKNDWRGPKPQILYVDKSQ